MNKWLKGVLTVVICLSLIIGFVFYSRAIFRDKHICNDGDQKRELTQGDITYLECGVDEEHNWTDMIKDNKIVREKVIITKGESHIETFETNWTDKEWVLQLWLLWVILALISVVTICAWFIHLIKEIK